MKYTPEQLRMWAQFMDDTSDFPPDDITAQFSDVFRAHADALDERGELIAVLRMLLNDSQHINHNCGDTEENCPVLAARALLARIWE